MMKKTQVYLTAILILVLITGCGKDFEGSGNKEAASAEQLALRLDDPWEKPIEKVRDKLEGTYQDGSYTAVAYGMEGKIEVSVSIKDNVFTVDSIRQDYETQSVGGYEAIRDGVYARQIEAHQGVDIDGVAGATITTKAIQTALREILDQAQIKDNDAVSKVLKDGTYSASKDGFGGKVSVTLTIKEGKLVDVKVQGDKETVGQGGYEAIQDGRFSKWLLEKGSPDIDTISGATITSNAVKDAMAKALQEAQ